MNEKLFCICGLIMIIGAAIVFGTGCSGRTGNDDQPDSIGEETHQEKEADPAEDISEAETAAPWVNQSGTASESAEDDLIDFEALKAENPDIYAWLYIPGTDLDYPILRASQSDDHYQTHGSDGQPDEHGCVYTEMYNNMDMSDFNTIIHGADDDESGPFYDLHMYEDPDYFDAHRTMYIVLPYTTLTYEIIAAYYDEGSDIMRRHDYTTVSGCSKWITDYENHRSLGMVRTDPVVPLNVETSVIVTLDGLRDEDSDRQFVVIASLTDSGSAQLTRYLSDEDDGFYESLDQTD